MKSIVVTTIGCIALLASCQQIDGLDRKDESLKMYVEANIGGLSRSVESRYSSTDNTPNSLVFDNKDCIGVFVDNRSAVKWTKGEGKWNAESTIYWPDKSASHDFYAYYPYVQATSKESVQMPSLTGQTGTIESLSVCDFLVAKTQQSYAENAVVSFTGDNAFKHVSSLLAITIDGESDLKTSTIKKISFEAVNIASTTTYSFFDNKISFITNELANVLESADLLFTMKENVDHTFYFIANSGIELKDITFTIRYSTDGVDYVASKTGLGTSTLTSGNQYSFKLNIRDGVLSITGSEIQKWGDGGEMDDIIINNPEKDEKS